MRVLVVEDDRATASFVKQAFVDEGNEVHVVYDGDEGLLVSRLHTWDQMILDIMLPGMDGLQICKYLRASGRDVPILMMTARDTVEDKILGLDSGADDYIVKPFELGELLARSRALMRRRTVSATVLELADLTLDPMLQKVMRSGKTITLSRTEYALLDCLMRNAGQVVSRAEILQNVWSYDFEGHDDNVLDVYINYLRKKIDRDFDCALIHTARGKGYWIGLQDEP